MTPLELLCRGMWELAEYGIRAVDQGPHFPGMRFLDINRNGTGMGEVWLIFVLEWAGFMGLAWYLEQVLSSAIGIRKHWLFPLRCSSPSLTAGAQLRCGDW